MKPYLTRLIKPLLLRLLAPELSALRDQIERCHAALSVLTLSQGGIACRAGIPLEEMIHIVKVSGNEAMRKYPNQAVYIHELVSEGMGEDKGTLQ